MINIINTVHSPKVFQKSKPKVFSKLKSRISKWLLHAMTTEEKRLEKAYDDYYSRPRKTEKAWHRSSIKHAKSTWPKTAARNP